MKKSTAFIFHEDYLRHRTGPSHPENENRLLAILDHLKKIKLWEELSIIRPEKAEVNWILKVHTPKHVEYVREMCLAEKAVLDMGDTVVCRDSYDAALRAAGGVLAAVDAVMNGEVRNTFCAVRPPGHHAEREAAMGFCLFNNVAVGARYIQEKYSIGRVAIVDWDVHHGNGTQNIFYDDASVLYISTHQYPYYPGTGGAHERGEGKGEGFTLNIPLRTGTTGEEYIKLFQKKILSALEDFRPEFILVSAGFDAHKDDPLAGILLTEATYAEITQMVKEIAETHCNGRIVSVLEGGYNLTALAHSVETHIRGLMNVEKH